MRVCPKNSISLLAITLGLLIASGCSGHAVRYGADSEGEGNASSDSGHAENAKVERTGMMSRANGSVEGNAIDGGSVDGVNPYLRASHGIAKDTASMPNHKGLEEGGTSLSNGTDYGQKYPGVDGSSTNPDPESWANAYLGKGHGSRDFYGDPSKAGTSSEFSQEGMNPESMNPATWAENYTRENGGPSLEYVNPDMKIAHADTPPAEGSMEMGGSVGIGKTDGNGLSFEHSLGTSLEGNIQDIYFAFDSWSISPDAARFLEEGAQWLHANPGKALTIEGHCDQRGTQDYNLVLGQKRAEAAKEYLIDLGVQPARIKIVSYGKERPFCQTDSEDCFQENRRNHMIVRVN